MHDLCILIYPLLVKKSKKAYAMTFLIMMYYFKWKADVNIGKKPTVLN